MSGAVGSIPSLTRSGRPLSSCSSRAPAGRASTAFLSRNRAASPGEFVIGAMLDCRPLWTVSERDGIRPLCRQSIAAGTPPRAPSPRATTMEEPQTPTLLRTPALGDEPIVQPDGSRPSPPRRKPKLKKLRLALILLGLAALALVSTVFGMLMAVASDLPALENRAEYRNARNSTLVSANDKPLATLTGNNNRILVSPTDISPNIKNALIAIEDKRFYEHKASTTRASPAPCGRTCCARRRLRAGRRSPSSS